MADREERTGSAPIGRCRCGHWATDHMVVVPVAASASVRLEPSGPCRRCGAAACRGMTAVPR
ncbi:MAG TPA: hypothetical protein VML94_04745 [Thermoplasmata archaeon]|nr:hypothetical protein [Thermoplasmata archaeon]